MVNTTRRSGVSLVEILVVIAILAILIGLLLPAISSVRMAASHTQSVNNIRQINLGMQSLLAQNSDQIRYCRTGRNGSTGFRPIKRCSRNYCLLSILAARN